MSHSASGVFGPAVTIGVGLGGLADSIVLHQLLGWHHLLSSRAGFSMRANEVADGQLGGRHASIALLQERGHPTE